MRGRCIGYHFQDTSSKVKVTRVVRIFGHVRPMALRLFDGFASYVALIQPISKLCVAQYPLVKRSKVKFTRVVRICDRVRSFTESPRMVISTNCLHLQSGRGYPSRSLDLHRSCWTHEGLQSSHIFPSFCTIHSFAVHHKQALNLYRM